MDANDGTIFFCKDTACSVGCAAQTFQGDKDQTDAKNEQCVNLPPASSGPNPGARSFNAQCEAGKGNPNGNTGGGGSGVPAVLVGSAALGAAVMAVLAL